MENMLVTGGCGFIGSNFIRRLFDRSEIDWKVINVDSLTYAGNSDNLSDLPVGEDRYVFLHSDITDRSAVSKIFREYRIDSVCHFAAETHVDRSILGPEAFIRTNIMGTFNLLEAAREAESAFHRFHHISTDEVYGDLGKKGKFRENDPYRPSSPYSAAKASSDHLVRAYHRTFGLPVTISNCSNNYGPRQFPEKLIPLMILNGLAEKPLPVYGKGENVRDWLYVTDHCDAIIEILRHGRVGETYNIGGCCELTNLHVVERICDVLDAIVPPKTCASRRERIVFVKDRPGHDLRYAVDCGKIERELGWKPRETFTSGLEKTIRWYMRNPDWVDRVKSGEYRNWIRKQYDVPLEEHGHGSE